MQRGDLSLVRQGGRGVVGLWEIQGTARVLSQDHHDWRGEYDQFVYCRAIDRYFKPFDDTRFFEYTDYARFKQTANELSTEDARTFLRHMHDLDHLNEQLVTRLRSELE